MSFYQKCTMPLYYKDRQSWQNARENTLNKVLLSDRIALTRLSKTHFVLGLNLSGFDCVEFFLNEAALEWREVLSEKLPFYMVVFVLELRAR